MCGIAGFTTFRQEVRDPESVIHGMTEVLAHRGPDGAGTHVDSKITLGHRRLSIIDIAGGAQPMAIAGGRYVISYNGEVYNYIELRTALEKKGHVFETQSDTEVILRQYAEDGMGFLKKLNGMFAFALWDRDEGRLILARDRMGIKPLFYFRKGSDVVFASEMKGLMEFPGMPRDINMNAMSKFLTYMYVPSPHTMYKDVHKLEAGHVMICDARGARSEPYWDIPLQDHPVGSLPIGECAERVLELLKDSIAKRLRSDVPVGVFLSGGVDSSAIAALASQISPSPIHTFSVGFEDASYDESPYARRVAEHLGTTHHHEVLSMKRAVDMLPGVMQSLDEPFGDPSILPTRLLSEFTSKEVKVVLGGDGGDELFAGYASFPSHKMMEALSFLPTAWRDGLVSASRKIPVSSSYASLHFLTKQFFKGAGISPEIRFFLWMGGFGNDDKQSLLSPDVQKQLLRQDPYEDILGYVRRSGLTDDFQRLLYLCSKLYLQDDILVKVDRASMAHSLEVRVPFLDHTLVDYASGIQKDFKLRGLTTKYVLKRAVEGLLPKDIIHRRKAGFAIPMASWIRTDLKDYVEDLCQESSLRDLGWFQVDQVRKLLDDHYEMRRDNRKEIWTLLSLLDWNRNYG